MNYFKSVSRGRIVFITGLLAIFLAGGPAWASDGGSKGTKSSQDTKGSKGNKGTKGSKGKKGKQCDVDADCKDGYLCGIDSKCHKDDDKFCRVDADCSADQFCSAKDSKCKKKDKNYCASDADCQDGYYCKEEDNKCKKKDDQCTVDADCKDGYVCAEDGKCHKGDRNGCETDSDCDAGEVCGDDGECHETTTDSCDDGDACTTDTLTDGDCQHLPIAGCGEPQAPQSAEICGDCLDNDNNGMTDFEDPACCSGTIYTMTLSKARLLSKRGATALNLNSTLARPTLAGVNALSHDLYVQIRPVKGSDVICARIPGSSFKHAGTTLKFSAAKRSVASAQGIRKVVVKVRHHGGARVKVVGKKMPMSILKAGAMQITLGFYNPQMDDEETRCSSAMASFRSKRKALVAP